MRLDCHPAATTSRVVRMFVAEQGIELDCRAVDIPSGEDMKPDHANVNPSRPGPVLEDDDDVRLTECSAIVKYRADKGARPRRRRT